MKYQAKTMYNFYVMGNPVSTNTSYCTKHNFTRRSGLKNMIANIDFGPSCIEYVIFGYQGKKLELGVYDQYTGQGRSTLATLSTFKLIFFAF